MSFLRNGVANLPLREPDNMAYQIGTDGIERRPIPQKSKSSAANDLAQSIARSTRRTVDEDIIRANKTGIPAAQVGRNQALREIARATDEVIANRDIVDFYRR